MKISKKFMHKTDLKFYTETTKSGTGRIAEEDRLSEYFVPSKFFCTEFYQVN